MADIRPKLRRRFHFIGDLRGLEHPVRRLLMGAAVKALARPARVLISTFCRSSGWPAAS